MNVVKIAETEVRIHANITMNDTNKLMILKNMNPKWRKYDMTIIEVLEMIFVIVAFTVFGFMLYFKYKGNALGMVSELIALAETTNLTGPEKMTQVVAELYSKVPVFMRKILTEKRIQTISQWIFTWMRKYAEEYKKALDKKDYVQKEEMDKISNMARSELIVELLGCTVTALKERAAAYGVELDGTENKKDLIKKVVVAIMEQA